MLTENLYIFPDAVNRNSDAETISLDITGDILFFYHNGKVNIIDTSVLADGTSTVVLNNSMTDATYVLFNFREILEALDMTPSEFFTNLSQRCFMQIDKSNKKVYIKVFLLKGVNELLSRTHDFSEKLHFTKDYIHELDWKYSWTIKNAKAKFDGKTITISFETTISDFWKEPIYISHGGQSALVHEGKNMVSFTYIETENAYLGNRNCRYKGRAIDLRRLINNSYNI